MNDCIGEKTEIEFTKMILMKTPTHTHTNTHHRHIVHQDNSQCNEILFNLKLQMFSFRINHCTTSIVQIETETEYVY